MNVCILQMLYFDRTNISEGIDFNKRSLSESVIFVTIVLNFHQMSAIDV